MNRGLELAVAMWALTAFSLTLVVARLYTRRRIVKFVGIEDHMYAWTGVFLLCFTVFIQVAVQHGLGKSFWGLSIAESSDAIFWTYVANSFAITGNAMAKLSMGLFLLRVVQARWQRVVLWLAIAVTSGTSIALVVMLWNQTTPIRTSWDPLRTPGKWNIEIQPMSVMLGVWSSACDFLFAIFPWLFIKELRMPQREKVMLAGGMSLGVIAGACGIVRTVVLSRLDVYNYTLNFVPYFAWAGAEIAVAMICIGIPTLRPLYLKTQQNLASAYARSQRRGRHGRRPSRHSQQRPPFAMVEGPLADGGGGGDHKSAVLLDDDSKFASSVRDSGQGLLQHAAAAASARPGSNSSTMRTDSLRTTRSVSIPMQMAAVPRPVSRPQRAYMRDSHATNTTFIEEEAQLQQADGPDLEKGTTTTTSTRTSTNPAGPGRLRWARGRRWRMRKDGKASSGSRTTCRSGGAMRTIGR
ncbi:uncharacterized protein PG986_004045 [Apiospora aurea]|uniref:Rhodopsin domain-containing protein n=1 Tax=Apiospora aurea TaxID=335848 RepID=A0ABR1QLG8_9PEZI